MFNLSAKERECLKVAIITSCESLTGVKPNYHLVQVEDCPQSFLELKRWRNKNTLIGNMPVLKNGDTVSIYGAELNELVRYWHDIIHLKYDYNFTTQGDLKCALTHVSELGKFEYISERTKQAVFCDIYGQAAFYAKHKKFIIDGATFVYNAMINLDDAIENYTDE